MDFVLFFKTERNAKIHLVITVSVVIAGFVFGITRIEWLIILLCIGIVLVAEALNTAIEKLGNAISSDKNRLIKSAKDIAAGAVLLAAITAAIIGGLIFLPYLF